jgi:hypothetical protein
VTMIVVFAQVATMIATVMAWYAALPAMQT